MAEMNINTQEALTRNLRKPLGISLLHSASDWIFRGFPGPLNFLDLDLAPAVMNSLPQR